MRTARPKPLTDAVNAVMASLPTDGDVVELLSTMADVDEAIKYLKTFRSLLETSAVPQMKHLERIVVEHVGVFRRTRRTPNVQWDDRGVARAVVQVMWDTNKIGNPRDAADAVVAHAHIDYWRIDPLKALGIDPYEFRASESGAPYITQEA